MLPRVRLLLAPLVALAAVLVVPSPALAADGGTTTTTDVVLYDECQQHAFDWSVTVPALATFWRLDVNVFDPDGFTSEQPAINKNRSGTSGTFTRTFCGSETPGTWTIKTGGSYQAILPASIDFPVTTTTFTVRLARTDTSLTRTRLKNGRWKIRADVREEGPSGFFPATGLHTRLERLVDGRWKNVARSVLTSTKGTSTVQVRFPAGTKLRGVTAAAGNHGESVSRPVTLTRKRRT